MGEGVMTHDGCMVPAAILNPSRERTFPIGEAVPTFEGKADRICEARQKLLFRWLPAAIENSRGIAFQAPDYTAPRKIKRDIGIEVRLGYNLDDG